MDLLQIKGLSAETCIGIYAWEQAIKQRLLIDISISSDFSACIDDIAHTIDYAQLCQQVTQFVETHSFQLIETVANEIAQLIKQKFKISALTISVSKPQAVKNASDIRITVNR